MKSFEKIPTQAPEKNLYRERSLGAISKEVSELAKLEQETEKNPLSAEEKEQLLAIEARLARTFEFSAHAFPTPFTRVANEYFLTAEGKTDAQETLALDIPNNTTLEQIKEILFENREKISSLSPNQRADFSGRSFSFRDQNLTDVLFSSLNESGEITLSEPPEISDTSIIISPEKTLRKIKKLKRLKAFLKKTISSQDVSNNFQSAFRDLIQLYQEKVNNSLIDCLEDAAQFKSSSTGNLKNLSESEQELAHLSKVKIGGRDIARYDKVLRGASLKASPSGYFTPVSKDLEEFAEALAKKRLLGAQESRSGVAEKGLSEEKITRELISPEEVKTLTEELLSHYNLLSLEDSSSFSPDRKGAAPDGKWQVLVNDKYRSLSVSSNQKIVKIPNKPQQVDRFIAVTLAHEVEGHVLQRENRDVLPLELLKKFGGGRARIFSECGAMHNQEKVLYESFGKIEPAHPHYLRAAQARLDGGNLLDCIKAFYQSQEQELEWQELSLEDLEKKRKDNLRLATNRTLRLFRGGANYASHEGFIDKSDALVYLEQEFLFQELEKVGLERYAYVSGSSFSTLKFLLRYDLLDSKKILFPKFYSQKIWEKLKERYQQ